MICLRIVSTFGVDEGLNNSKQVRSSKNGLIARFGFFSSGWIPTDNGNLTAHAGFLHGGSHIRYLKATSICSLDSD